MLKVKSPLGYVRICEKNRYSEYVGSDTTSDYEDLRRWQRWFEMKGIASVIHKTAEGFALYREGLVPVYDTQQEARDGR